MRRLILYIGSLVLLVLAGCQIEDLDAGWTPLAEDEVRFSFVVSSPSTVNVATRSDESRDRVDEFALLIFESDSDDSEVLKALYYPGDDFEDADNEDHIGAVTVKRNKLTSGLVAMIANANDKVKAAIASGGTMKAIKEIALSSDELPNSSSKAAHVFYGYSFNFNPSDKDVSTVTFNLYRTYSEIRLVDNSSSSRFIVTGFKLSWYAESGVLSGNPLEWSEEREETAWCSSPLNASMTDDNNETINYLKSGEYLSHYSLPILVPGVSAEHPLMLIVKGHYEQESDDGTSGHFDSTKECYYSYIINDQIEVTNADGSTMNLNSIDANTCLVATITQVGSVGYDSEAKAIANPGGITVRFTDKTSEIQNIITDGRNALAVPDTIHVAADVISEINLTIHSRYLSSSQAKPTIKIKKSSSRSWLTLNYCESEANEENTYIVNGDKTSAASDYDDGNSLYNWTTTVPLTFRENSGSEREMTLTVSLDGTNLSRDVVVIQAAPELTSLGGNVFDIKLEIYEGTTLKHTIDNYSTFVRFGNAEYTADTDTVYGIASTENGGRIRNQGMHWPMPNSTDGNTTYKYTITLKSDRSNGDSVTLSGIDPTSGDDTSTCKSWVYTFTDGSSWDYRTYPDAFTYTTAAGAEYTLDIYHTGFFHQYKDEWYYYEVFKDATGLLWLDRNLQAKSAGMAVLASSGSYLTSDNWPINSECAGAYVTPVGIDNSNRIPAGWRLPEFAEYQKLYAESSFSTNILSTTPDKYQFYAPSYKFTGYEGSASKTIRAYFPQVMMQSNGVLSGESQAGYYITSTPADAENWYTIVQFLGLNATSQNRNMGNTWASARCVFGSSSATATTWGCKVQGFTHVYIYYESSNYVNTNQVTVLNKAWPGEQIAVHGDINRYHPFSYSTYANLKDDRVKIIFNTLDDSGNLLYSTDSGKDSHVGETLKNGYFYYGSISNDNKTVTVKYGSTSDVNTGSYTVTNKY